MNKILLFCIGLVIGIGLGQWWRMEQVEPTYRAKIQAISLRNKEIREDLAKIDGRLMAVEAIQKKIKK